jgi:hypothetical protein
MLLEPHDESAYLRSVKSAWLNLRRKAGTSPRCHRCRFGAAPPKATEARRRGDGGWPATRSRRSSRWRPRSGASDSRCLHHNRSVPATVSVCCKVKTVSVPKIPRHVRLARARLPWCIALSVIGLVLVSGYPPSAQAVGRADPSIKQDLLRGVRAIRVTRDRNKLHLELVHLVAHLRRAHGTTTSARRGRELALRGFEATLTGIRSQLDFSENDSGEVAAATRDAKRADLYLRLGANWLRAAGQALGVRIGELNGY